MKSVRDVINPKEGRWIRYTTKTGEVVVGKVLSQTKSGCVLDSGFTFNYANGDRIEWYGSSEPKLRLPVAPGDPVVRTMPRGVRSPLLKVLTYYAAAASTAALGIAVHLLLK